MKNVNGSLTRMSGLFIISHTNQTNVRTRRKVVENKKENEMVFVVTRMLLD